MAHDQSNGVEPAFGDTPDPVSTPPVNEGATRC